MVELKLVFPGPSGRSFDGRTETMLMASVDSVASIMNALRNRGTIHANDSQFDVVNFFHARIIDLYDATTGNWVVTVEW